MTMESEQFKAMTIQVQEMAGKINDYLHEQKIENAIHLTIYVPDRSRPEFCFCGNLKTTEGAVAFLKQCLKKYAESVAADGKPMQ